MMRNNKLYIRFIQIIILALIFPVLSCKETSEKSYPVPPRNGIYVIAHRGFHKNIPENTIAAYRKAIDLGCDFVEIDTRTTRDGRIISMHNATVDEYAAGASGTVAEMTFEEIRKLDTGIGYGTEFIGSQVPSFEEILQLCKGRIGIYLDLKAASVKELVRIIKENGMERNIIWYIPAGNKEIGELAQICPDCIITPDPGKEENLDPVINRLKPSIIATDMGELTRDFVRKSHQAGALVFADEADGTPEEWLKMIKWNTDGIQTDDPEGLIRFLKAR